MLRCSGATSASTGERRLPMHRGLASSFPSRAGRRRRGAYAGLDLLATAVLLLDRGAARDLRQPGRGEPVRARRRSTSSAIGRTRSSPTPPALSAAIDKAVAGGATYTEQELELARRRQAEAPPHVHGVAGRHEGRRAAARVPAHRPAAADRARGAAARPAAGEPRADPQPRARDQESARRPARRGAAARARARPAGAHRVHAGDHQGGRPPAVAHGPPAHAAPPADVPAHQHPRGRWSACAAWCWRSSRSVAIRRDYDVSLPAFDADQEQLIQALLNIVRNAAQALEGDRGPADRAARRASRAR